MKKNPIDLQQTRVYFRALFGSTYKKMKEAINLHNELALDDKLRHEARCRNHGMARVKGKMPVFRLEQRAIFRMGPCIHLHQLRKKVIGNVRATYEHIVRLFIANNKHALIRKTCYRWATKVCSLATQRGLHYSTIQRHMQILARTGFVRAIERTGRGLALWLDATFLDLQIDSQAAEKPPVPYIPVPAQAEKQPAPIAKYMARFQQAFAPQGAPL